MVPFRRHSRKGETRDREVRSVVAKESSGMGMGLTARELLRVKQTFHILTEMVVK